MNLLEESTKPAALTGIEPVAWRWIWKSSRDQDGYCYTHTKPNKPELQDIEPLYSAATVERLVQERDKWRNSNNETLSTLQQATFRIAASQARETQLREALEILQGADHGDDDAARIESALALPQDDTALRQWGAKLLRERATWFELRVKHGDGGPYDAEWIVLRRKADELEAGNV